MREGRKRGGNRKLSRDPKLVDRKPKRHGLGVREIKSKKNRWESFRKSRVVQGGEREKFTLR